MTDPATRSTLDAAGNQLRTTNQFYAASLLPEVYAELRRLAAFRLSRLPPGQTLAPTELVHEAFGRLARAQNRSWENDRHFLRAAAVAMRCILIDHIRARAAKRRHIEFYGARPESVAPDDATPYDERIEDLDAAIARLEAVDPRAAEVVTLKTFLGLAEGQIATALGISDRTVRRDWAFAKAWLEAALTRPGPQQVRSGR